MLGLIRDCHPVRSWSAVHLIIFAKTEIPNQDNKGKNKGSRTILEIRNFDLWLIAHDYRTSSRTKRKSEEKEESYNLIFLR